MAKIKVTFPATLVSAGFTPGLSAEATFSHNVGEKVEDYQPVEHISVPVDGKKLAKLLNVTDVEITITVTPKGAKKPRKAKAAKTAPVVAVPSAE